MTRKEKMAVVAMHLKEAIKDFQIALENCPLDKQGNVWGSIERGKVPLMAACHAFQYETED